jgi:hypothetical protein
MALTNYVLHENKKRRIIFGILKWLWTVKKRVGGAPVLHLKYTFPKLLIFQSAYVTDYGYFIAADIRFR